MAQGFVVMLAFAIAVLFVGVGAASLVVLADSGLRAARVVQGIRAELRFVDLPAVPQRRLRAGNSIKRAAVARRPEVLALRVAA